MREDTTGGNLHLVNFYTVTKFQSQKGKINYILFGMPVSFAEVYGRFV